MTFKEKKAVIREKSPSDSEFVRRFKANPFIFIGTVIVLIIVIIAFVLVPAIVPEYGMGGGVDLTFGSYDKAPISYVPGNYFARYYSMVAQYRQSSIDPDNYQFADYRIWREAFEGAALHTAILQEMKKSGYTVPTEIVDREVAQLPQFQENGRFSSALYQRLSSNERLALWRQAQEDLTKERFYTDVTGLLKPSAEGAFIGKMASPRRSFDMVSFSAEAYPDTELARYAAEHPELFRTVHHSKITINSSEREAGKILDSIKNGTTTFEDAARTQSQDSYAERGGDMGIKMAHELNDEITGEADREKIIALGRGEYSDVIKLASGWAFFRAEDAAINADVSDPATLEKVRSYVRNFERGRMEDWAVAQARDFIARANGSGFDESLQERGLEKLSFGPLPINYGNIDLFTSLSSFSIPELSGSSSDENFWTTAFSTPVNTLSEPLVQGSNVLVLLPTEETEAEAADVEAVSSAYSGYWLSYMSGQSLGSYFLNSEKMDDRFLETYFRYFLIQSE
ncbi:MAG: SurA N-terminal domain-containing protein [Treponema sp.]|jgi:hypothetical protein|nr:SurA N-terminal domain-containing protein [Treponema sp.]